MKRLIVLLTVPLVMVGLVIAAPAARSGHPTTAANQRLQPNDAQIEASIRTKLAKSKIGRDGFRFRVQRGVVTWEGTTNVMQHKGSATRMARSAGAVQVVNNIQVSASAKAKAAGNLHKAIVEQ